MNNSSDRNDLLDEKNNKLKAKVSRIAGYPDILAQVGFFSLAERAKSKDREYFALTVNNSHTLTYNPNILACVFVESSHKDKINQ